MTIRAYCPRCDIVLWQDDDEHEVFYCPNCGYEVHVSDLAYLYDVRRDDTT